jgi:nicotinate phosphoribosyltransferase
MPELDRPTRPVPRPLPALLTGENADVYFLRTERVLAGEGRNPLVTMEVFCRRAGATLCGIDEAKGLLSLALEADAAAGRATVWALKDGDQIAAKEVVLRIRAPYQSIVRLETAYLGMMAHGTGWATAARAIVDAAAPTPVIAFGARHVHPNIADRLDYAAIIGGAMGASTTAGSARAGRLPVGTMPHALVLIFGDTVEAALAFDRHIAGDVPRIVLVDTFRDESEESTRVAAALGGTLAGVRLDRASELGGVTPALVAEVRAALDAAGAATAQIVISGGVSLERIAEFKAAKSRVDTYAVGSAISGIRPIDFTADIHEIDGQPIGKRGRPSGVTATPRLREVDLAAWRAALTPTTR